jgi:hypothetical protein
MPVEGVRANNQQCRSRATPLRSCYSSSAARNATTVSAKPRVRCNRKKFMVRPVLIKRYANRGRRTTSIACGGIGRETIWQSVQSYTIRRTSMQQMHRPGSRLMRIQGASFSILLNGMKIGEAGRAAGSTAQPIGSAPQFPTPSRPARCPFSDRPPRRSRGRRARKQAARHPAQVCQPQANRHHRGSQHEGGARSRQGAVHQARDRRLDTIPIPPGRGFHDRSTRPGRPAGDTRDWSSGDVEGGGDRDRRRGIARGIRPAGRTVKRSPPAPPICRVIFDKMQGGPPHFIAESHYAVRSWKNFSLKQRAGRSSRNCREEQGLQRGRIRDHGTRPNHNLFARSGLAGEG